MVFSLLLIAVVFLLALLITSRLFAVQPAPVPVRVRRTRPLRRR